MLSGKQYLCILDNFPRKRLWNEIFFYNWVIRRLPEKNNVMIVKLYNQGRKEFFCVGDILNYSSQEVYRGCGSEKVLFFSEAGEDRACFLIVVVFIGGWTQRNENLRRVGKDCYRFFRLAHIEINLLCV